MKDMANVLLIVSRERTRFDNESRQRSLSSANNNRVGQVFALISRMTPQTKLVTIRTYFTNRIVGLLTRGILSMENMEPVKSRFHET